MALQLQMRWQLNRLHQKRKNGPPLGLRNLGNTCYLNSVLQCLTYTPPLANLCLSFHHSSLCNSLSEAKRDCAFCILEKRIVRSLSTDLTVDAPAKLLNSLRLFAGHFRLGHQEDAHEFLRYVIDACHNTCLRLKKLQHQRQRYQAGLGAANGGIANGGIANGGIANGASANGGINTVNGGATIPNGGPKAANGSSCEDSVNGSTVVMEIFGGALQSQVKCLCCGTESNKVDEIMDISLDVLHSSSLKEAMQKFFQPEILDGNNKYRCENCKKLVAARKQMSILQAPNVLVIQLKRFEGIFGGKIDKNISFEEVLVLSSYMSKTSQDKHPEYNLFGTIVHSGFSPESGHYYAYVKDAVGRWYCCNDSYVSISTLQEVLSEKVYILFFSRNNKKPLLAKSGLSSNGLKSCDSNGNIKLKNPKTALPLKAGQGRDVLQCPEKVISARTKVDKVSFGIQMKDSSCGNPFSKRNSTTEKGKLELSKKPLMETNGDIRDPGDAASSKEEASSPINENGAGKCKIMEDSEKNQALAISGDNGKIQSIVANSVKDDLNEKSHTNSGLLVGRLSDSHKAYNGSINGHADFSNGVPSRRQSDYDKMHSGSANGLANIQGSKRKGHHKDSCILLAKDAHSQAKLAELKELLGTEALSVLRSCGWTDKVYSQMCSRKKLRAREGGLSKRDELKKMLIAETKGSFISQIPETLKASLIERLRSVS